MVGSARDSVGEFDVKITPLTARFNTGWPGWLRVLIICGFCFALGSGLQMQRNQHGVDDFNQFYVGARLVFSGHLYDPAATQELQEATVGMVRRDVVPTRLPFNYVLLWPLARLRYATARAVWLALMVAAAMLFSLVYPTRHRVGLAAAAAVSLPLFAATLGQRQDVALLLLILALALRLRAGGRLFVAGMVLALLLVKFHLFLLVPIALLVQREWRMFVGLCVGGAILFGICFGAGTHWPWAYIHVISSPVISPGGSGMPNLHGVLAGFPHAGWWELGLGLVVVLGVVAAGRRNGFELAFTGALLGSFLVSNHAYLHDCAVLIPGLVEIVTRRRLTAPFGRGSGSGIANLGGILAVTLLTPFPYFLPPLLVPIREGVVPAVLIGVTLLALVKGENKA